MRDVRPLRAISPYLPLVARWCASLLHVSLAVQAQCCAEKHTKLPTNTVTQQERVTHSDI